MFIENPECRICYESEKLDDLLISPCKCKGTSKYIHESCLSKWRYSNTEGDAFNKCMECNHKYIFRKLYNNELINLFGNNFRNCYFVLFSLTFINTLIIWPIEEMDNYLLIKILDNNNDTIQHNIMSHNKTDVSLLELVKSDKLAPFLFYFTFSMFIECLLFYMYFIMKSYLYIYRKKYYLNKIKKIYLSSVVYTLQFIIWYYLLVYQIPFFFLFFVFTISLFEPYMVVNLLKKHEKLIIYMNKDNGELILPIEEYNEQLENTIIHII